MYLQTALGQSLIRFTFDEVQESVFQAYDPVRTSRGKAYIRKNALKHGLFIRQITDFEALVEDPQEYQDLERLPRRRKGRTGSPTGNVGITERKR